MAPPKKPAAAPPEETSHAAEPAPAETPEAPSPAPPPAPERAAPADQEIVAVGTIAHVLRRAFHAFYADAPTHATPPPPADPTPAERETEAPPVHPYVALGASRKQLFSDALARQHTTATALLTFLDERTSAAAARDEAAADALVHQGLVVKAQIPMGPSTLALAPDDLAPFGAVASSLILAKTLIRNDANERLEKSGNGPTFLARKVAAIAREPPGYLGTTSAYDVRKATTLALHEEHLTAIHNHAERPPEDTTATHQPRDSEEDDAMPAHEQRKNLAILARMQTKLDFVRNPRYVAAPDAPCFVVAPSPLVFAEYDAGGIYEQSFAVRNASALSRRVRVLPPATLFFSIAAITFPDASGLVAPGMHVHVALRFAPDSRAEYKDAITIQYEQGPERQELTLPVVARRPPPELSIPLLLRAQPTLVGTQSVTVLPCRNTGGRARFWLMSEHDWARCEATAAFRPSSDLVSSDGVRVGPFTLAPSEWELGENESVDLQLTFLPSGVGEFRDKVVMVCDNCLVRVFTLAGRACQVDVGVVALNDHVIDRSIASMGSVSTLVVPTSVYLQASATQQLVLGNDTPLDLPFQWRLETAAEATSGVCPFRISPETGVLAQNDTHAFEVVFTPHTAQRFTHWRLVLYLENVPACSVPGPTQLALISETYERLRALQQDQRLGDALVALTAAEPLVESLRLGLDGTGRVGAFRLQPAVATSSSSSLMALGETCTLTTRVVNDSDAAIRVRWDATRARLVPAKAPNLFRLSVDPLDMALAPRAASDVSVSFTPLAVGRFAVVVPCAIVDTPTSTVERWLRLEGAVAAPQLRIVSRELDFGLVLASASGDALLTIQNDSPSASGDWTLSHLEAPPAQTTVDTLARASSKDSLVSVGPSTTRSSTGSIMDTARDLAPRASLSFAPSNGTLAPGATLDVRVTCHAGSLPERFRGTLALRLASQPPAFDAAASLSCVSARGEIQSPNVFLTPLRFALGTTFLGVAVERTLALVNVSNLEAAFKFFEPLGPSKAFRLEVSPCDGVLGAKETLLVTLRYTPLQAGKSTTLVACSVKGLATPLGVELASNHKGLVLAYDVVAPDGVLPQSPQDIANARGVSVADGDLEPEAASLPKLLFGDAIPLAQRRTLRLVVRNFSGMDATLELAPKRFRAAAKPSASMTTSAKKLLLSDASDRHKRFQTVAGRAYIQAHDDSVDDTAVLSDGRGVAFVVANETVRIAPWAMAVVPVTCVHNLPGVYSDVLTCRAAGLPPVLLPVHATVVGTPLTLDPRCVGLHIPFRGTPIFTMGSVCVHTAPVTQTLRVRNNGPRAATLAWRLVDPAREHERVRVSLRVDFAARIALAIESLDASAANVPFHIAPTHTRVAPFATASVAVTFVPTDHAVAARAVLIADAQWQDGDQVEDGKDTTDPRCESPSPPPSRPRLTPAAGKALQAVRMANAAVRPHATISPGAVQRPPCIRVLLRASGMEPELSLDQPRSPIAPYHVTFTTWSTLRRDPAHAFHRREVTLVNRSRARLTFRLEATGPFAVTRGESLAPRHPLATADLPPAHRRADGESFLFTLPPQLGVKLELRVDPTRLESPSTALRHRTDGALLVRFTNQTIQTLRLACDVLRPRVVASPSVYAFGRVYVGKSRVVVVRIANPTRVPAAFHVRHVPRPAPVSRAQRHEMATHHAQWTDDPSVFAFAASHGTVEGPTVSLRSAGGAPQPQGHSSRDLQGDDIVFQPLEMVVTFTPSATGERYKSRFRLTVDDGVDCDVVLEGQGHLDEVEYKDQDRALVRADELTHANVIFKRLR